MKQLLKTVIFLLVINHALGQEFYVSPTGHNDKSSGTAAAPIATLTKAQVIN